MSFREIIAELPNVTEDEKRQLLDLLAQQLSQYEESPEFLAMLKARIDAADRGTHRYTLAETPHALQNSVKRAGRQLSGNMYVARLDRRRLKWILPNRGRLRAI
jgi:hypothetical protein